MTGAADFHFFLGNRVLLLFGSEFEILSGGAGEPSVFLRWLWQAERQGFSQRFELLWIDTA